MTKYRTENNLFLAARILRKLPISNSINVKFNSFRHKRVERILLPYFQEAYKKVGYDYSSNNDGPIFVFWWQGEYNIPPIVKKCIQSIKNNSNHRQVLLITKDNLMNFLKLSNRYYFLLKNKKISMAHFSDIVRYKLLEKYGGLWLDATILVTKPISKKYFSNFFTCSGYDDRDYFFVTRGNWCSFLIGGSKHNPVFQFMSAFYDLYWQENDAIVDYFIIDYALKFAWSHNLGHFKEFTSKNKYKNNPHLFDLANLLNQKFSKSTWKNISKNTEMYKLTYKKKFKTDDDTFYSFIMKDKI